MIFKFRTASGRTARFQFISLFILDRCLACIIRFVAFLEGVGDPIFHSLLRPSISHFGFESHRHFVAHFVAHFVGTSGARVECSSRN